MLNRFLLILTLFHLSIALHAQTDSIKPWSLDHDFLQTFINFSDSACNEKAIFENFLITDTSYIFCGKCIENNELSYFQIITDKDGNKLFEDYQDSKHAEIRDYQNIYIIKGGMMSFSIKKVKRTPKIVMQKLTPQFKPVYEKILDIDSVWGLLTTPKNGGGYFLLTEKKHTKGVFTIVNLDEEGNILWRVEKCNSDTTNTFQSPQFLGVSNNRAIVGITGYKYNRSNPIWRKLIKISKDEYKLIDKNTDTGNIDFINGYLPTLLDSLNILISTKNFYRVIDINGELQKTQKLPSLTQAVALIYKSHLYRIGPAYINNKGGVLIEALDFEHDKTIYRRFIPNEFKNGRIKFAKYDEERKRLILLITATNINHSANSMNRLISVNCEGFISPPAPSFNYFSTSNEALIYPTIQNADKAIIDYGDGTKDTIYSRHYTTQTLSEDVVWDTIQHTYPDTGVYEINIIATSCGSTKQLSDTVIIKDEIPYVPLYSDFIVQRNLTGGQLSSESVKKIIERFQTASFLVERYKNKQTDLAKMKELIENDLNKLLVELYPIFYNDTLSGKLFYSISHAYKAIGNKSNAMIWLKQAYYNGANITQEEKLLLEHQKKNNFHVFNGDTIYNEDYMKLFKYEAHDNQYINIKSAEYLKPQDIKEHSGYDVITSLTKNNGGMSLVDKKLNKIKIHYFVKYNGDTLIKSIRFFIGDKQEPKRYTSILFENGQVTGAIKKRSNFLGFHFLKEFDKYENIVRKSIDRKTWLPRKVSVRTGPFTFKKEWRRVGKHVVTKKYNQEGEVISVRRGEKK